MIDGYDVRDKYNVCPVSSYQEVLVQFEFKAKRRRRSLIEAQGCLNPG
jgi:hypothetical protein